MKQVIIVSCVFPPEPVVSAQISKQLADYLSNSHSVTVISPKPSRPLNFSFSKLEEIKKYKHIIANTFVSPQNSFIKRFLESVSFGLYCFIHILLNCKRIDVVYMNTWPIFAQWFVMLSCKITSIPFVIHVQDIYPESLSTKLSNRLGKVVNSIFIAIDKSILRNAKKIIVISDKMKDYLSKTRVVSKSDFTIVYNWQIDGASSFLNIKNDSNSRPFTFMYLGNIGPLANLSYIIKVFSNTNINSQLIIAGSGSDKENCKNLVQKLKVNNIHFLDVPDGKVFEIQSWADCLLLPMQSGAGNFSIPSKLIAYLFSAKPILACIDLDSDISGILQSASCGWLVAPDDYETLLKHFDTIPKLDYSQLNLLGNSGRNFALSNLSQEINLKRLSDSIEDCLTYEHTKN
jgi:glycosyltransferase involved in cell wall biosynthesis